MTTAGAGSVARSLQAWGAAAAQAIKGRPSKSRSNSTPPNPAEQPSDPDPVFLHSSSSNLAGASVSTSAGSLGHTPTHHPGAEGTAPISYARDSSNLEHSGQVVQVRSCPDDSPCTPTNTPHSMQADRDVTAVAPTSPATLSDPDARHPDATSAATPGPAALAFSVARPSASPFGSPTDATDPSPSLAAEVQHPEVTQANTPSRQPPAASEPGPTSSSSDAALPAVMYFAVVYASLMQQPPPAAPAIGNASAIGKGDAGAVAQQSVQQQQLPMKQVPLSSEQASTRQPRDRQHQAKQKVAKGQAGVELPLRRERGQQAQPLPAQEQGQLARGRDQGQLRSGQDQDQDQGQRSLQQGKSHQLASASETNGRAEAGQGGGGQSCTVQLPEQEGPGKAVSVAQSSRRGKCQDAPAPAQQAPGELPGVSTLQGKPAAQAAKKTPLIQSPPAAFKRSTSNWLAEFCEMLAEDSQAYGECERRVDERGEGQQGAACAAGTGPSVGPADRLSTGARTACFVRTSMGLAELLKSPVAEPSGLSSGCPTPGPSPSGPSTSLERGGLHLAPWPVIQGSDAGVLSPSGFSIASSQPPDQQLQSGQQQQRQQQQEQQQEKQQHEAGSDVDDDVPPHFPRYSMTLEELMAASAYRREPSGEHALMWDDLRGASGASAGASGTQAQFGKASYMATDEEYGSAWLEP